MLLRNDLRFEGSPSCLEVLQLTSGPISASHVYMEAQIFTPDSCRFVFHECANAHGGEKKNPNHRYMVCDIDEDCSTRPIIEELDTTAPSVSPDGKYVYYFIDETEMHGGRLTLKRVGIDGANRETIMVIDAPLHGTDRHPSLVSSLSTIRSDGRKIALSCFLGNGKPDGILWGLVVFDLHKCTADLILSGGNWINMHPQYCRSLSPEHMDDILILENHGNVCDATGNVSVRWGGAGNDIHVVRDDGREFRDMPFGRDSEEVCQGHFCWRGNAGWAIDSTWGLAGSRSGTCRLIEGLPVPHSGHLGAASPDSKSNILSASFPNPAFLHFATDARGSSLVADTCIEFDSEGAIHLAVLDAPGSRPALSWSRIAAPRSSRRKEAHMHPFLSPDGAKAFFNSDESGTLQTYMVRGLEYL